MKNHGVMALALMTLVGCGDPVPKQTTSVVDGERYTDRMMGSAEAVGDLIYVASGMSLSGNLSDVGAYDISKKAWTAKADIPTLRTAATSVAVGKDIYIIGGRTGQDVLSVVEKYSTVNDSWETRAPMSTGRWSAAAVSAGDKIFVVGGISGTGDNRKALDTIEAYDPKTDSWQQVGRMTGPRQGFAMAVVEDKIYIISGKVASYVESTSDSPITNRVEYFDPQTQTWTKVRDIPVGRVGAKAVVSDGLIFVVGGLDKDGGFPNGISIYDPKTDQWTAGPTLKSGRSGHMCALVADTIVVFGGSSVMYGNGPPSIDSSIDTISIASFRRKN